MPLTAVLLGGLLLAGLGVSGQAQAHRDPLTDREVELLRDSAQVPKQRIEYLVGFARERMLAVDRLRGAGTPGPHEAAKMGELLSDLALLIDELDDNLEMYNKHSEDLRRPLRRVLDAEGEIQQKLKGLRDAATPGQKRQFAVELEDASDAVESSSVAARAMLADQLTKKGEEKKEKGGQTVQPAPTLQAPPMQVPGAGNPRSSGRPEMGGDPSAPLEH